MKFFFHICILLVALSSCKKSNISHVLKLSGDNRKELEAVLEHYKSDFRKLEAARFLMENMDAHYAYSGEAVERYSCYMDSVFRNCNGDRMFWIQKYDSILNLIGWDLEKSQNTRLYDMRSIKSEFLIAHIDSAFTVWQQNWNKQYSFNMFCRYVLPYRIGNEPLSPWRSVYIVPQWVRDAYESNVDNNTYAYGMANDILGGMRSEIYYQPQFLPDLSLTALQHVKSASCKEYAHLCVAVLRAHGLPATIDFTPQWGNRSMGHEWCVFFPNDHTFIPFNPGERLGDHFMKRKEDRLTKVFRITYEKQGESLFMMKGNNEQIPGVFNTPCIMDVTAEYTQTSDVEVELYPHQQKSRFVYLSVFDNQDWSIVHWGRVNGDKAVFRDMARDVVYMPVFYNQNEVVPAGSPFLLDKDGTVVPIQIDATRVEDVTVKRKFRDVRSNQFLQGVIGGKFQVANKEDFSDSLTIHTIPRLEDNKFYVVAPHYQGKYRYFRYLSPDWSRGNMAELYAINEVGDTLKPLRWIGNLHVRPWCGPENLMDGNVLSFYDSHDVFGVWYGFETELPEAISRIVFLPRNDDNFIREGEEYELFYWNHDSWISLGRKLGTFEAKLTYADVPKGALFRLHNCTKGSEERIFTYEQSVQRWW